jgi:hypothetical protein
MQRKKRIIMLNGDDYLMLFSHDTSSRKSMRSATDHIVRVDSLH